MIQPRLFEFLPRRIASLLGPLFEYRCAACASPVPRDTGNLGLCPSCAEKLRPREAGFCPMCGNMTAIPAAAPSLCGRCLDRREKDEARWSAFFFFASYEGLLRDLILRCKSGGDLTLARLLGRLLASHPAITGPYDALIPIPLHTAKLRKRGFNQTLEIARPLAAKLYAPLRPDLLFRSAPTRSQAGLSLEDRKRNVRNAFTAADPVRGLRVLLVDDVATTCATLEEAAATLRQKGAASVDAAVLARTPEHAAR